MTTVPSRFRIFKSLNKGKSGRARQPDFLDAKRLSKLGPLGKYRVLAECLADGQSIRVKEFVESFEVYAWTRRLIRRPHVADLCCGHGLVGLLFAVFEPSVERVTLLDHHRSETMRAVVNKVQTQFPWVEKKIQVSESKLEESGSLLTGDCSIVSVHACGPRTDACLALATSLRLPIAVLPCCYQKNAARSPALKSVFGAETATDIVRTQSMEEAKFEVHWFAIPAIISPMNRIIVATPRT